MMNSGTKKLLICDCERTMSIDAKTVRAHAGFDTVEEHSHLCRAEIGAFEKNLNSGSPLCIACTQESPLFAEIAEEAGKPVPDFVNIRETAGWTADRKSASPKMAALLAAANVPGEPARLRTVESDGLCLVIGSGQQAFETAELLNRSLSVTLLLAGGGGDIVLPTVLDFPVFSGRVTSARGSLGAFDVTVDGYAAMLPSSRGALQFAMPRDGANSQCSVIFDMTGGSPLFARTEGRDGYFRVDPDDPAAVMRAVFEASDYAGEFEKPIYVSYDPAICAHERSKITGCTKCLDNCPPGAITPDGDNITIDSGICGGCGNCAAHCPTGAIAYGYPSRAAGIGRIQALVQTYLSAGGKAPVLLLHDAAHGLPLIGAMARFGRGLPANVIPHEMHSTSGIGHDFLVAALLSGFCNIVVLAEPRKQSEYDALAAEIELTEALLGGLGLGNSRVAVLFENDPDTVENALFALKPAKPAARQSFVAVGGKREVATAAISALAREAKRKPELVTLPASAPYGAVQVDIEACTLCMACVSACPADALRDNPEKPQLRFVETACVQCGICANTCPENAITLEARYNFSPSAMQPATLHEDEPAECIRCGKPFASQGMLDRVAETLGGKHWMFESDERVQLIRMCESCRLEALSEGGADPFAIAQRPRPRTTDDYVEAEKRGLSAEDFLAED
jgi:ferredoxin